jgi:hypothetical protein
MEGLSRLRPPLLASCRPFLRSKRKLERQSGQTSLALRLTGDTAAAGADSAATALRLYRDMDMRHWLPQAEAAADGYASSATTA